MKRFFLSLVIFLLTGFATLLPAQQARFDQATYLLEQNEYREAVQLYKSIADEGYESGSLWLNLGITYIQLDSLGMAKYYFLQAEQFPETRILAEEALVFVNERFNRRSAVLPPLPWDRFFEFLSHQAGTSFLVTLGLIFLYAGVASLIYSWFQLKLNHFFKTSGFLFILFSFLVMGAAWYVDYLDNRYGTGVMIERQAAVYELPDPGSPVVSNAYEGYILRVDHFQSDDQPGWHYTRLENGMNGWVKQEGIRVF